MEANLRFPDSYTAVDGVSVSALPSSVFTPSSGCGILFPPNEDPSTVRGTWIFGGETITAGLLTIMGTEPLASTLTTSFAPSDVASYVGVAIEGMHILVHQASDIVTTSAPTSATTSTSTSTSRPNSATRCKRWREWNGRCCYRVLSILCSRGSSRHINRRLSSRPQLE